MPEINAEQYSRIKANVKQNLQRRLSEREMNLDEATIRRELTDILDGFPAFRESLGQDGQKELEDAIVRDIIEYGPIQPLLDDPSITEVMVNGPHDVFFERDGIIARSDAHFDSIEAIDLLIDRIAAGSGRVCNDQFPQVDARLADGSRVHATKNGVTPGVSTITIRKFSPDVRDIEDYVKRGSCSEAMGKFLLACVAAKSNILVTGGTGAGKTTLLNALSVAIPVHERVITIEDNKELMLRHEDWVAMEARPANSEGSGEVTIRELVRGSLRMRPDRIVVGECRGGEAFDMLQAMNTGHDGSLTTIHANDARAGLTRLESMVRQTGEVRDLRSIVQMMQSALDIIVHVHRTKDGKRVISEIQEVADGGGDNVKTQLVFSYDDVTKQFSPSGFPPQRAIDRFRAQDVDYDPTWFRADGM